ncbi:hypothetical protein DENSPDRAFT_885636 [Dentipellis sp. KUC8613]|nr:hypothetical protein DENSPDRAFT_885636 [Dentipellis sp. KUC8613]
MRQLGAIDTEEDVDLYLRFARAKRDAQLVEKTLAEMRLKESLLSVSIYMKALSSARAELLDAEMYVGKVRAAVRRSGLKVAVGIPSDTLTPLRHIEDFITVDSHDCSHSSSPPHEPPVDAFSTESQSSELDLQEMATEAHPTNEQYNGAHRGGLRADDSEIMWQALGFSPRSKLRD